MRACSYYINDTRQQCSFYRMLYWAFVDVTTCICDLCQKGLASFGTLTKGLFSSISRCKWTSNATIIQFTHSLPAFPSPNTSKNGISPLRSCHPERTRKGRYRDFSLLMCDKVNVHTCQCLGCTLWTTQPVHGLTLGYLLLGSLLTMWNIMSPHFLCKDSIWLRGEMPYGTFATIQFNTRFNNRFEYVS